MDKLNNINLIYVIIGIVFIAIYYYILYSYGKKIKNKKSINNIDDKEECVKNFHILAENYESAPSYNKSKIKPVIDSNNSKNWKLTLDSIHAQADELSTNNSLDQYLFENDIDLEK